MRPPYILVPGLFAGRMRETATVLARQWASVGKMQWKCSCLVKEQDKKEKCKTPLDNAIAQMMQ